MFRHDKNNPFVCFYCGDPADQTDHQPPITRVDRYRSFGLLNEIYIKVPCCGECNKFGSDICTMDLFEREMLVKNAMAKRYRRALRGRNWDSQDVKDAELRGSLKRYVAGWSRYRDRIQKRLDYVDGVNAYMDSLDI